MTPFVPALLIKLTLILSLGLVVAATLRSLSPSFRHLILYATMASCVALPLAMWMSPQWDVQVLPSSLSTTASVQSGQVRELTAGDRQSKPFAGSGGLKRIANATPSNSVVSATVNDVGPAQRTADTRGILATLSLLPLLPLLPVLWVVGFAAVMAWLAVGRFGLRRIAASAWPLDSPDWSAMLDEEREYAGIDKPVRLYSSSAVSTPLTWGSRAPVVLLPEDALDWPEEHRRIVLRHELAHVARGDSFTQLVAGFVCGVYWFHPLVWIAERRLRAECERACDDSVVSLGTPAAEYAAHLLEVARSARAFGAAGFLSVAMARPSQLEGRLLAVLNESRRRVSLSRGARPAAALLAALVLIPLAAFRAVPITDRPAGDGIANPAPKVSNEPVASGTEVSATMPPVASAAWSTATSSSGKGESGVQADTTLQMSVAARSAGTLTLDLKTGGNVVITGWDQPQVLVRASLRGRDWRDTRVTLRTSDNGARLQSDFAMRGRSQSTSHVFQVNVPGNYNVRISSAGGSVSITGVDGKFTGQTGGGEINIEKAKGEVDIQTGGGDVHVSDSRLDGNVSTGGGVVRIEGNAGNLSGESGSGPVVYAKSGGTSISHENGVTVVGVGTGDDKVHVGIGSGSGSGSTSISTSSSGIGGSYSSSGSGSSSVSTTTSYDDDGGGLGRGFAASGIRMNSAGGGLSLRAAPDGARVTTGGGPIRIGPSGGEVYASTGGGSIDIGPATGSVEAHTGAGDVTIELKGDGAHSVDVSSGKGRIVLVVPRDLNATLDLETAYTNNFGHKTRIISDVPIQTTETSNWDDSHGTPRRYIRAQQTVGRGGGVIRVRAINGDIVLNYANR